MKGVWSINLFTADDRLFFFGWMTFFFLMLAIRFFFLLPFFLHTQQTKVFNMDIPPRQPHFDVEARCSSECTSTLPPEVTRIFILLCVFINEGVEWRVEWSGNKVLEKELG